MSRFSSKVDKSQNRQREGKAAAQTFQRFRIQGSSSGAPETGDILEVFMLFPLRSEAAAGRCI